MNRTFLGWAAVVLLLILAMWQNDRQWERLRALEALVAEQARDLRALRQELRQMVSEVAIAHIGADAQAPTTTPRLTGAAALSPERDAFARARAVAQRADYAEGDWLVRALPTGIATLTPYISSDAYSAEVQGYIFETLLQRDPETLAWQGWLAQSWEVSPDGLTITFRLRPGIVFSDGTPLTAEDVAFTFRFVMDERIAAPRTRAYWRRIAAVEALDARTVRFRFAEPYFDALGLAGGMAVLPRHYYERFLDEPQRFNQSRALLLGSGPYRLRDAERWTPDLGFIELERNPRYWGPVAPPFDRLVWRVITNDTARLTAFRNGEIDVYGARPIEFARLKADERLMARAQAFAYLAPTAGYSYIAWNQRRGGAPTIFADKRIRQALTLLTDKQRIIDEIFLGYAEAAVSPFNPRSPQHDPNLEP